MRVILADDHVLVRSGIRSLLETIAGVEVVAEADDGGEALEKAKALRPDLVLLDIAMKPIGGLQAAEQLAREVPDAKVLILSMHDSGDYVARALRAGARCYVLKDAAPLELALALDAIMRGETFLSPRVSAQVVAGFVQHTSSGGGSESGAELTGRQREILRRIAEGQNTKQIASDLEVSVKTIEAHRAQLMDRLGIRTVPGLVRFAVRIGLVSSET
jgi:DNA-binding NarL/FixJ family response regulator